ncbi:PREDICTED: androgen-dependent TFPI-regulating protein isoform X2 [Chinchilla lanigera]|uniref:androgen-dependent TFPI-regulating protein isoform X2 n=1 Tax=Chinchilla lanigera TaxID=34839 RepID=UPI0006991F54|nr:PREDICTED: androgen-dependent TFPI-regulating protein isoform X2 [Chinchilla lanigera]
MLGRAMVRTATCVYHFILLNWYIFLNYYVPQQGTIFQGGAQSKYLTLLNLLLQAVYFGVACLDDVLKRIKRKKDIKFITALRDLLFATLAFPVCTFVFLMFWTIFLYDRELVYPKLLDGILPAWLNHSVHTFILLFSLIEIILRPHQYPSKKTGLILLAVGSIGYISRVLWLHSKTGHWVYPVLAKLSPVGLAAFFFLSYSLTASLFLLGERLNHWKWDLSGRS